MTGAGEGEGGSAEADALFDAVARALLDEGPGVPRATYRLQLHARYTFRDALALVDYLDALGVSHLYLSPCFKARRGSEHGYDVVDHGELNPEIGTLDDFRALGDALRARGMGLILDVVPNHMGIGGGPNPWWHDVVENGPSSVYADYFDIDWHPQKAELANRLLLPVLGDHYGKALDAGELQLGFEAGAFFVRYYEWELPLNPRTYHVILDAVLPELTAARGEADEAVLELQSILTGLGHLPERAETDPEKKVERNREKEILKRRLAALVEGCPELSRGIAARLAELNGRPGDPASFDELDRLLELQAFRLSYFRVAAEEINYRRFFDLNDLAAIRVEHPPVFQAAHRLVFALLGEGRVTGLRIDHPDGLWDPAAYLRALQRGYFLSRCRRALGDAGAQEAELDEAMARLGPALSARWEAEVDAGSPLARALYVVVEKILLGDEALPGDWLVHGTVGYEFGALAGGLLLDRAAEPSLDAAYAGYTERRAPFARVVHDKKRLILQSSLASELAVLSHALARIAARDRHSRDFTRGTLTDALRELIAWFPVYRTYVDERSRELSPRDRRAVERALVLARRSSPTTDPSVYAFLRSILLLQEAAPAPGTTAPREPDQAREKEDRRARRAFVMKLQQLTGPVMAKGLEDTAFYVENRLVSLNEVGSDPARFGVSVAAFHEVNLGRRERWPGSLLATSTHDSKRGEDVRARISVLSEIPAAWEAALGRLREAAEPFRLDVEGEPAPDRNEEYLYFQTVLGAADPAGLRAAGEGSAPPGWAEFVERMAAFMGKALKEAKLHSSWISPDPDYESAVYRYVRATLEPGSAFLREMAPLVERVVLHGRWNSLSQLAWKLCAPGVPDFYQGTERWQSALVDPDNRRTVDFARGRQLLREIDERLAQGGPARTRLLDELVAGLMQGEDDGRIKLFLTRVGLALRRRRPALFQPSAVETSGADYRPIEPVGMRAEHAVAFARGGGGEELIVVAPRLTVGLCGGTARAPLGEVWLDTILPARPGRWVDELGGGAFEVPAAPVGAAPGALALAEVLAHFPVALLTGKR